MAALDSNQRHRCEEEVEEEEKYKQVHYDEESAEDEQEIDSDEEQVYVKGAVADIYLKSDGEEEVYYSR